MDFVKKNWGLLGCLLVLAVIAFSCIPRPASAQTPIDQFNAELQQKREPVQETGSDPTQCSETRVLGRRVLDCGNGRFGQWERDENGRTVMVIRETRSGDEADMLNEAQEIRRRQRSYSPRFGGSSYALNSYGYQCIGNVSTIRDYYTPYCQQQRDAYEQLRRNQHNPCIGDYAFRYPDVCRRWRNGTYGRGN